jgi:hypothetical protein
MKYFALLPLVFTGVLLAGCAHHRGSVPAAPASAPVAKIVTPSDSFAGKVAAYNDAGRFVVLNFPGGQLPKVEQTLFLYRAGLKVAEIRVTGPQSDDNTVADIITGDAQVGDLVQDQ